MNIVRKGRTYSDQPSEWAGDVDRYSVERVSLLVAKDGSKGRWEAFTHSRPLMERLDRIGNTEVRLAGLQIAGKPIGAIYVGALNLYLKACQGLISFRRDQRSTSTRGDFESLLSKVGINYSTYARPIHQVCAGPGNPGRS